MIREGESQRPREACRGPIRQLLWRDGPAAVTLAILTIVLPLGTYALGGVCGAAPLGATLAALAVGAVWVAIAAPVAAAGGSNGWGGLLRAGAVADSSAVALAVLWLAGRGSNVRSYITFLAAVEIYCTYAAMALAGAAAVLCAKKPAARYAVAAGAAAILMAALATPFWIGGVLQSSPPQHSQTVVAWAVLGNPFYSITSAVVERTHFTWHHAPVMYQRITRIGTYAAPPPVAWHAAAWRYAVVAAVFGAVAFIRRRTA